MSLINDALKRASQMEKMGPVPRPAGPALQPVSPPSATLLPRPAVLGLAGTAALAMAGWLLWQWFQGTPAPTKPTGTLATSPARGAVKDVAAKETAKGAKADSSKVLAQAGDAAKTGVSSLADSAKSAAATLKAAVASQVEPTATKTAPKSEPVRVASVIPPGAGVPAPAPAATAALIPSAVVTAVSKPAPVTEAATAPRLLDPVAPAPQPFPPLRLQGVIYRSSNASAFINGRVLFVGDKVEEAVLTKVDRQSVTFEMGGQTKVVQLAR